MAWPRLIGRVQSGLVRVPPRRCERAAVACWLAPVFIACSGGTNDATERPRGPASDGGIVVHDAGGPTRGAARVPDGSAGTVRDLGPSSEVLDAGPDRPLVFSPEPLSPEGPHSDPRLPPIDAGVRDAGARTAAPSLCLSAAGPAPSNAALIGRRAGELLLVRADGSAVIVGPAGDGGKVRREHGRLGVVVQHSERLTVYRLATDGALELAVDIDVPGRDWRYIINLRVDEDGTLAIESSHGSVLLVHPDGSVERHEAPERENPLPTDEYYWVAEADVPGWHVVSIPSGVIPLRMAFYESATDTLQPVSYASSWIPSLQSGGRIVYLGETDEGSALIDEGPSDVRVTPLPAQYPYTDLKEKPGRVVVNHNSTPVAWLDAATREVTLLSEVSELLDAGAHGTSGAVSVVRLDGEARWLVDRDTLESRSLAGLDVRGAGPWTVLGTDRVLVLADGLPVLWIDRGTEPRTLKPLPAADLQVDDLAAAFETVTAEGAALVLEDGWPRAVVVLDDGEVRPLDLGPKPAAALTVELDSGFLVTANGIPVALLTVPDAEVARLVDTESLPSFDEVVSRGSRAAGVAGGEPLWLLDADTLRVERFDTGALPLPREFYDPEWDELVQGNAPPLLAGFPALTHDGTFVNVFRDDARAASYAVRPGQSWQQLGEPVAQVDWLSAWRRSRSWVIEAGPARDCYCTWPVAEWSSPEPEEPLLAESTQLLPDGLPPFVFEGRTTLAFDNSDSCVIVHVEGGRREVIDLTNGVHTTLDGFDSLVWVSSEGETRTF